MIDILEICIEKNEDDYLKINDQRYCFVRCIQNHSIEESDPRKHKRNEYTSKFQSSSRQIIKALGKGVLC